MDAFAALSDPTRRAIVELLAQHGQLTATEIADHFTVSAPAISQHLKVLREAQVVHVEKRAQQRIYRINPSAMLEVEGWARRMTQFWQQRFDVLEQLLQAEQSRLQDPDGGVVREGKDEKDGNLSKHQAVDDHAHV